MLKPMAHRWWCLQMTLGQDKAGRMEQAYPILEYDSTREAMIEPDMLVQPLDNIPEHCVICFFQDVIEQMVQRGDLKEITTRNSEMGRQVLYGFQCDGQPLALFHPGIGAPLAAVLLEEAIAIGCKKFIACGGSGVLDSSIAVGCLLIPVSAVRDEGTSYHYLPPGREIQASPEAVAAIERVLQHRKIDYRLIKTWTTDGPYRETPQKIALRKSENCQVVEMEAAAFFAVAEFRRVQLAQILYSGDDVGGEDWDHRDWQSRQTIREELVWLAAEACLGIGK
jgi:uridine phosphorylase